MNQYPEEVRSLCYYLVEAVVHAAEQKEWRKKVSLASAPTEHEVMSVRKRVSEDEAQESGPAITSERFIRAIRDENVKVLLRWYNDCVSKGLDVAKTLNNMEESSGHVLTSALEAKSSDIITLLLKWGLRVSPTSKCTGTGSRESPLFLAVAFGNENVVQTLLQHMSQSTSFAIDERGSDTQTALHKACFLGKASVVKLLLGHGASATLGDSCRSTALHFAVESGDPEVVRVLLRIKGKGRVNLHIANKHDHTPLMIAAMLRHTECAAELIHAGAIPRTVADALHVVEFAIMYGAAGIVRLLVENGACSDSRHYSPLLTREQQHWIRVCATRGYVEMLKLLLHLSETYGLGLYLQSAGCSEDLNSSSAEQDPALLHALELSHWDMVRWLVVEKKLLVSDLAASLAFWHILRSEPGQRHLPVSLFRDLIQAYLSARTYKPKDQELKRRLAFLTSSLKEVFHVTVEMGPQSKHRQFVSYAGILLRMWPESEMESLGSIVVELCCDSRDCEQKRRSAFPCEGRVKRELWSRVLRRKCNGSIDEVAVALASGEILLLNKSVLSCRCHFFKSMFLQSWKEKQTSQVDLRRFDSTTMMALFEYIYTGEIDIVENVDSKNESLSGASQLAKDLLSRFNHETNSFMNTDPKMIHVPRFAAMQVCFNLIEAADYFIVGEKLRSYAASGIISIASMFIVGQCETTQILLQHVVRALDEAGLVQGATFSFLNSKSFVERVNGRLQMLKRDVDEAHSPRGSPTLQSERCFFDGERLDTSRLALKTDLQALWDQRDSCDCVLVTCDKCQLRLHTIILEYSAPQFERFEVENRINEAIRVVDISSTGVSGKVAKKLVWFCYSKTPIVLSNMKEIREILQAATELGIENVATSLVTDSSFSTENMAFPYKGGPSLSAHLHSIDRGIYSSLVKELRTNSQLRDSVIHALLEEHPREAEGFTNDVALAFFALLHARCNP